MQFQVPQFIEIEDKIVGPFSWKQFIYMLGGLGLSYVLYRLLPIYVSIILIMPILGLAGALTFFKVNNRPFVTILEAWFSYMFQSRLYIWKKPEARKEEEKRKESNSLPTLSMPTVSNSKLKDLSWSLDVLDVERQKKG